MPKIELIRAKAKVYWRLALFQIVLFLVFSCVARSPNASPTEHISRRATQPTVAAAQTGLREGTDAEDLMALKSKKFRKKARAQLTFEKLELRELFSVSTSSLAAADQPIDYLTSQSISPPALQPMSAPPLNSKWTPLVYAGSDVSVALGGTATLTGEVISNRTQGLTIAWSVVSGPGTVTFGSPNSANTTATFSAAGVYELELTATNAFAGASDRVRVTANQVTVPENLIEMFARKDRRATAIWGAQYLEDSTTFQWQPETFMYRDIVTGAEVWKLSNTPKLSTYYHDDIGVSPWNADGSKLAFTAWNRLTQAYSQSLQSEWRYIWMTADTNGSGMRPTVEAHRRLGGGYFHWSPQEPNTWYEIGESHLASGGQSNVLYRSAMDEEGVVTSEAILTLPSAAAGSIINKLISADGRQLILEGGGRFWPISILPDGTARLDDPDGYSVDRNFGPYGGMNGGTVTGFHDQYIAGLGDTFFVMPNDPNGTATWWRIATIGSASDGGPLYTGNDGNDNFGEVSPENYKNLVAGNLESPFVDPSVYSTDKTSYWSHFVPDRWGVNALFSNMSDKLPIWRGSYQSTVGPGVWNFQDHEWVVPSFGGGAQHHDWHGFTDWVVSSGGSYVSNGAQLLLAGNINDPNSQVVINDTHTRYDGGTSYASLARPGQSPDGTKVSWHSEFLNGKDAVDIYWSVVYKPYAPTDLEAATATGGGAKLSFLPPKYTDRGWINPATGKIDEANGEALYAREIKQYQVWRSNSPTGGWQTVGSVQAEYANDPVTNTLKPIAGGNWVSPNNKITFQDNPGNGVWYYAVTSREHSGLESDELSEVIKVTVSGGSVTSTQIVQSQGQKGFWTQAPTGPSNLVVDQQVAAGHYRLTWTEANDSKVRYYNIYYGTTGNPTADQSQRIASLPIGSESYLDWLANKSATGFYGITAVDWYGNESAIVYENGGGLRTSAVGSDYDATNNITAAPSVLADAAINDWGDVGFARQDGLRDLDVQTADLPGLQAGVTSHGRTLLEIIAAGHGWFVNPTPYGHLEFEALTDSSYLAHEDGSVEERWELLTFVAPELAISRA